MDKKACDGLDTSAEEFDDHKGNFSNYYLLLNQKYDLSKNHYVCSIQSINFTVYILSYFENL